MGDQQGTELGGGTLPLPSEIPEPPVLTIPPTPDENVRAIRQMLESLVPRVDEIERRIKQIRDTQVRHLRMTAILASGQTAVNALGNIMAALNIVDEEGPPDPEVKGLDLSLDP